MLSLTCLALHHHYILTTRSFSSLLFSFSFSLQRGFSFSARSFFLSSFPFTSACVSRSPSRSTPFTYADDLLLRFPLPSPRYSAFSQSWSLVQLRSRRLPSLSLPSPSSTALLTTPQTSTSLLLTIDVQELPSETLPVEGTSSPAVVLRQRKEEEGRRRRCRTSLSRRRCGEGIRW